VAAARGKEVHAEVDCGLEEEEEEEEAVYGRATVKARSFLVTSAAVGAHPSSCHKF